MTKTVCNALISILEEYRTGGQVHTGQGVSPNIPITDKESLDMYKLMAIDIDRVLRIRTPLGDVDIIHDKLMGDKGIPPHPPD